MEKIPTLLTGSIIASPYLCTISIGRKRGKVVCRIAARDGEDEIATILNATKSEVDGYYYTELPDDTVSFLNRVSHIARLRYIVRFEVLIPGETSHRPNLSPIDCFTLSFHTDYD